MKTRKLKRTAALLSMAAVIFSASSTALAADATYVFDGADVEVAADDLFGTALKGLMPGDVRTLDITLQNNSGSAQDVYLSAEAKGENPLTGAVEMKLWLNNALIYWGNVAGEPVEGLSGAGYADMYGWMTLGRFSSGAGVTLRVEISVPGELGNDYQNIMDHVVWKLRTQTINTSSGGGGGGGGGVSNKGFGSSQTPAELFTIEDEPVPLGDLPKTGGSLDPLLRLFGLA